MRLLIYYFRVSDTQHSTCVVSTETTYKKETLDGEVINDRDLPVFLNLDPFHQQQNQFAVKPVKLRQFGDIGKRQLLGISRFFQLAQALPGLKQFFFDPFERFVIPLFVPFAV